MCVLFKFYNFFENLVEYFPCVHNTRAHQLFMIRVHLNVLSSISVKRVEGDKKQRILRINPDIIVRFPIISTIIAHGERRIWTV